MVGNISTGNGEGFSVFVGFKYTTQKSKIITISYLIAKRLGKK